MIFSNNKKSGSEIVYPWPAEPFFSGGGAGDVEGRAEERVKGPIAALGAWDAETDWNRTAGPDRTGLE